MIVLSHETNKLYISGLRSDCPYRTNSEETPYIPDNICLSSKYCNVCNRINGVHEGCNHPYNTSTPVCDLDKSNTGIDATATRKIAECVGCKKLGKMKLT